MTENDRPPAVKRESIGDMLRRLIEEFIELVRSELQLARTEVQDSVARAAGSLAAVAVGGVMAIAATSCLLVASIAWLAQRVGLVSAALIVAGVFSVAAIILIAGGVARLKRVDLAPKRATANLIRNVETLKGD